MCELCQKLSKSLKNNSNEVEINFDGYFKISIKFEDDIFYLVSEWIGCPKFEEVVCGNSYNGANIKNKIDFCPKCGGKLSIYRLTNFSNK